MRHFSNTAVETEVALLVTSTTNTIIAAEALGYPATKPFTIILAPDTGGEEICLVTDVAGTTFTVERGWGGTTAIEHAVGTRIRHGAVAEDFREAAMAFQYIFGDPTYDPANPSAPPTNNPIIPTGDYVVKSDDTWGGLLP